MIDISDGLAADVHHICEESRCGAVLRAEGIPLTTEAFQMNDTRAPLDHGLTDGEDFELAFAVSPEEGRRLITTQPLDGINLTHVGDCVDAGLWFEEAGARRLLEPRGYVHELR
jgi:thiamine-monophosphate kinase